MQQYNNPLKKTGGIRRQKNEPEEPKLATKKKSSRKKRTAKKKRTADE